MSVVDGLVEAVRHDFAGPRRKHAHVETWLLLVAINAGLCFFARRVADSLSTTFSSTYRAHKAAGDTTEARRAMTHWINRAVGIFHSVVSVGLMGLTLRAEDYDVTRLLYHPESWIGVTPLELYTLSFVVGFMCTDIFHMVARIWPNVPGRDDCLMFLHHGVVILVFMSVTYKPCVVGATLMCYMVLFEISTPCLNVRWMLIKTGRQRTPVFWWNGLVFVTLFFIFRIIWGTYIVLMVWYCPPDIAAFVPFTHGLACASQLLQYYWFVEIIVVIVLRGGRDRDRSLTKPTATGDGAAVLDGDAKKSQ